jgi:hypothetical protein
MEIILTDEIVNDMNELELVKKDILYIIKVGIKQVKRLKAVNERNKHNRLHESEEDSNEESNDDSNEESKEESKEELEERSRQRILDDIGILMEREITSSIDKIAESHKKGFIILDKSLQGLKFDGKDNFSKSQASSHETLTKLHELSTHFSKGTQKGKLAEREINKKLEALIPGIEITDTSSKGHMMDTLITVDDIPILIEIKNLETNVSKKEVDKFEKDMKTNSNIKYFILCSVKSGIAKVKEAISFGNSGNQIFIYISNGGFECTALFFAIRFICMINESEKSKDIDYSNKEKIQAFINHEFDTIKTVRKLYDDFYDSQCKSIDKQISVLNKQQNNINSQNEKIIKEMDCSIGRFKQYLDTGEINIKTNISIHNTPDLEGMSKTELQDFLKEKDIDFKSKDKKAVLIQKYLDA